MIGNGSWFSLKTSQQLCLITHTKCPLKILVVINFYIDIFQIKEGAEKLREVATDKRALSDVASIVKKSNTKLQELKSELHELESQIILTQANSNGKGKCLYCLTFGGCEALFLKL